MAKAHPPADGWRAITNDSTWPEREPMTTTDELRNKAIEAMCDAYKNTGGDLSPLLECMTAAFDALHGIVLVVPIRCTADMVGLGQTCEEEGQTTSRTFDAMAAFGDITRPEGEK